MDLWNAAPRLAARGGYDSLKPGLLDWLENRGLIDAAGPDEIGELVRIDQVWSGIDERQS